MRFLKTLAHIMRDQPLSVKGSNDELDYSVIKNVANIFKLNGRIVTARVVGKSSCDDVGMPGLLEGIYKLQHHWSQRVYEKAIILSRKYLSGE